MAFLRPLHRVPRAALLLAGAVLATSAAAGLARADSHDVAGARDRAADARTREQALAAEIAAQSREIDSVEGEIGGMRGEVAALEDELAQAQARLRRLDQLVAEKTQTLQRARRLLTIGQARLGKRLADIYTADAPDLLSVALGARSLEELIDVLEARERVLVNDGALVGEIEALRGRVVVERSRTRRLRERQARETALIEQRTNERRSILAGLVARRDTVARLRSQRQRSLASVRVERTDWEAQAAALAAASARVASVAATPSATPAEAQSEAQSPTPSTPTGGFAWPLRGTVVSPYGQRWGRLHSGVDIAAPAGTSIVASAAGTVVFSGTMSGYGLLVVVQHGGGISTAYAHNSANLVSVGQSVAQGQAIASVGCTGHCSGDHVHFEVRSGGAAVDPMGYL